MVLDAAEQNWLAALKKHTQVKEKNFYMNPLHTQVVEEEVEEESDLLAALYPPRKEETPDNQLEEKEEDELHFFCCKHPGRPVECLPHTDWHIRRKVAYMVINYCQSLTEHLVQGCTELLQFALLLRHLNQSKQRTEPLGQRETFSQKPCKFQHFDLRTLEVDLNK